MAYNQFTLQRVLADFALRLDSVADLYPGVPAVPIPPALRAVLPGNARLAATVHTEYARGQLLTGPLLAEVWRTGNGRIALLPGVRFDVDADAELTGVCDYILGLPPQLHFVTAPVVMVAEAKNDDLPGGLGKCAAGMVAAQRSNAGRNPHTDAIHGAVTDGQRWRFLRLRASDLAVELGDRLIADVDQIYGILLHVCGLTP